MDLKLARQEVVAECDEQGIPLALAPDPALRPFALHVGAERASEMPERRSA